MADALNLQNALNLARNVPALAATVTVVDDAGRVVTTVCPDRSYILYIQSFKLKNPIRPIYCTCAVLYYYCDVDFFPPSF